MGCATSKEATLERKQTIRDGEQQQSQETSAAPGKAAVGLSVPDTKQPPFSHELYSFVETHNLSALGVLLLCSGRPEASKLRSILSEICTLVNSVKVSSMGRPWTLQLAALGMDCLRMLQNVTEPRLAELSQPIDGLSEAVADLHALVRSLLQPGWLHEYAKGNLSSRKCITTHQAVIQAMLEMGLDLRLVSRDHSKLAYAATMAPVMEFLMQAEDGDAVAGAVRLHNSSTAQHELADISGIPVDVIRCAVQMSEDGRSSGTGTSISMSTMSTAAVETHPSAEKLRNSGAWARETEVAAGVHDGGGEGSILESSMIAMDDTLVNTGWLDTSMTLRGSGAAKSASHAADTHRQLRLPVNQSMHGMLENSLLNASIHGGGSGGTAGLLDTSLAVPGCNTDDATMDFSLLDTSLMTSQNKPTSFRLARVTSSSDSTPPTLSVSSDDVRPASVARSSSSAHAHPRPPLHNSSTSKMPPLLGVPETREGVMPCAESLKQATAILQASATASVVVITGEGGDAQAGATLTASALVRQKSLVELWPGGVLWVSCPNLCGSEAGNDFRSMLQQLVEMMASAHPQVLFRSIQGPPLDALIFLQTDAYIQICL